MSAPVFLVSGIATSAMESATIGLQWDLPGAVVVRHRIDPHAGELHRVVSDVTGVLERDVIDLEHACISCAVREDIIPTIDRVTSSGRWQAVLAHLPVSADAIQVCRVLSTDPHLAPHARIGAVITAVDGDTLHDDLTCDELLRERGLHTNDADDRGVAEALAGLLEYSDLVAVFGSATSPGLEFARALARPGARLAQGWPGLDASALMEGLHDHSRCEAWISEWSRGAAPEPSHPAIWRLELRSGRPLHPTRLHDRIERLGLGTFRARGCFWLATRPVDMCAWDGAGGQLSIGTKGPWGRHTPTTRIVVTGVRDDGDDPASIRAAFDECVLTDAELAEQGVRWETTHDGLEPWLGPIRLVA